MFYAITIWAAGLGERDCNEAWSSSIELSVKRKKQ